MNVMTAARCRNAKVLGELEMLGWALDPVSVHGRRSWVPDSRFDTYFFEPDEAVLLLLVDWTPLAVTWFGRLESSLLTFEEVLLTLSVPFGISLEVAAWISENPFADVVELLPWTNAVTKREIRIALCRRTPGFDTLSGSDQKAVFWELCRSSPLDPVKWLRERVGAFLSH